MTKIRNILAATDLSPECAVVTDHAAMLSRRKGAELVILHVGWTSDALEAITRDAGAKELLELARESIARDTEAFNELQETLVAKHRLSPLCITRDGYADQAILDAADELGSDLIIVGTHGRTGLSRFFLGSVAERVVRLAKSTVLVTRPLRDDALGYQRIVVPIDFSEHTEPAIEAAIELMAEGGHIDLFHAVDLPGAWMGADTWRLSAARKELLEEAQQRGHELARAHGAKSTSISFDLLDARPSQGILDRIEAGGYDLCVVGSHGRRGIRRLLMGSVAERVVRHAPCSVAVARRPM